jgi:predicted nuclease of predicted toxin-antitoxin system
MSFRLLADENVDHRVVHRLRHFGHNVEHVDFVGGLGKGATDGEIAKSSLQDTRLILTSDDDFLTDFGSSDYSGLLFIEDETLTPTEIADIVHVISAAVDQSEINTPFYVSRNWL